MSERDDEPDDRLAALEQALREHAARTPRTDGPTAAAAVRARLRGERVGSEARGPAWGWGLAAAGAAAGALLVAFVTARFEAAPSIAPLAPSAGPTVAALAPGSTALGTGEVLIWLDARTPLYMTFAPPSSGDRGAGTGGGS